jgi:hypothetical protein
MKKIEDVGGTRHSSAVAFVARTKSVALVASHDGPLSLFFYDQKRRAVTRVRDLERLID